MDPLNRTQDLFTAIIAYIQAGDFSAIYSVLFQILRVITVIAVPFCLMLLIGIVYSVERLKAIRRKESEIFNAKPEPVKIDIPMSADDKKFTDKWAKILVHIESPNGNDWLLAIIEADIILGEMLDKMGYQGDSIGEKLKRVEKSDFTTLNEAWEAHKVRNAIAHQGSDFVLNQREAKRVIGLYRQVFEEFYYI